MYPALPTVDIDSVGVATLPDGRQVRVSMQGYVEGDTNAFVETDSLYEWVEDGASLTLDELNSEIEAGGEHYFLHEYVCEKAKWEK